MARAGADRSNIAPALLDRAVPIDSLEAHPKNARRRDKRAVHELRQSLKVNGQYRTVIARRLPDGRLQLLAGHGTVEQARELRWARVAADVHDGVDDETALRIVAVDNATSDLASYDDAAQVALLQSLSSLKGSGYDLDRLRDLIAGIEPEVAGGNTDPDDAPDVPAVAYSRRGDVWSLGQHVVVCGDATSPADWDLLLGPGRPVDLVITDPPYGVAYEGGPLGDRTGLINDDLGAAELLELLTAAFSRMADRLVPGRGFYVCSPSGPLEEVFRQALRAGGLGLRQQVVWVKDRHVLGRQDYHLRHESVLYGWGAGGLPMPVPETEPDFEQLLSAVYADGHETLLYGWRDGARHEWRGGRRQNSVWEIPRPARSKVHPTMKPAALYLRALQNSSVTGDVVADAFGGSGTLVITCEMAHRSARVLELDPVYVDVIVERWARFTGAVPELSDQAKGGPRDRLGSWDVVELRAEEEAAS